MRPVLVSSSISIRLHGEIMCSSAFCSPKMFIVGPGQKRFGQALAIAAGGIRARLNEYDVCHIFGCPVFWHTPVTVPEIGCFEGILLRQSNAKMNQ